MNHPTIPLLCFSLSSCEKINGYGFSLLALGYFSKYFQVKTVFVCSKYSRQVSMAFRVKDSLLPK